MSAEKPRLKLPNMNEFSPSVVGDLGPLLRLVGENSGNRRSLRERIAIACIRTVGDQRLNRANNVLIGMSECGLFNLPENTLTEFGKRLLALKDEPTRSFEFARHLLTKAHRTALLDITRSLELRREPKTNDRIRAELRLRGFTVTTNEGNASKIRLWLERSGVVDSEWKINDALFAELSGIKIETRTNWEFLDRAQRLFLLTLQRVAAGSTRWLAASHVKKLCLAENGPSALPEGRLRAKVLDPLETGGWIATKGKGDGRGGNIGEVRPTNKLLAITAELSAESSASAGIPKDLLKRLDTPLDQIYTDLGSVDSYVKGFALELLALRFCNALGLRATEFRKRGAKTNGAEVDLIADGVHLHYSRWIFQCKNTTTAVDLEDLAKEVGLAVMLKAHVVVMVTRGSFTKELLRYAAGAEADTHLQVILVTGRDLDTIRKFGEVRLVDIMRGQAEEALSIKAAQVREVIKAST